jgi:hypothetical protein
MNWKRHTYTPIARIVNVATRSAILFLYLFKETRRTVCVYIQAERASTLMLVRQTMKITMHAPVSYVSIVLQSSLCPTRILVNDSITYCRP